MKEKLVVAKLALPILPSKLGHYIGPHTDIVVAELALPNRTLPSKLGHYFARRR